MVKHKLMKLNKYKTTGVVTCWSSNTKRSIPQLCQIIWDNLTRLVCEYTLLHHNIQGNDLGLTFWCCDRVLYCKSALYQNIIFNNICFVFVLSEFLMVAKPGIYDPIWHLGLFAKPCCILKKKVFW